jgi:ferritin-like metal-binding protein YciE
MKPRHTEIEVGTRGTTRADTDEIRDEIVDWLRDAYGMERGLEAALKKQADNEDLSTTTRQRAAAHLEETRRHAEDVKGLLQSLGTDTSALKTGMGMMAQASKGMATKFASDERIKDLLDAYSMEHFEIACYTALAAAANRAGLSQVSEVCRRIITDEERMAQMLMQALPEEVTSYLFEAETEART